LDAGDIDELQEKQPEKRPEMVNGWGMTVSWSCRSDLATGDPVTNFESRPALPAGDPPGRLREFFCLKAQ
jgi:hypothetical protein